MKIPSQNYNDELQRPSKLLNILVISLICFICTVNKFQNKVENIKIVIIVACLFFEQVEVDLGLDSL